MNAKITLPDLAIMSDAQRKETLIEALRNMTLSAQQIEMVKQTRDSIQVSVAENEGSPGIVLARRKCRASQTNA